MTNRLKGKRALVTAAGQGMGRAAVLAFVREGATVHATDIDPKLLEQYAGNKAVTPMRLDVTDDDAIRKYADSIGAVDILFNCAGWVHQGSILECRVEDWDKSFQVNVRSMFVMCKHMVPRMIAAGGGGILNMASGLGARQAAPQRPPYTPSQAAGRS